MVCGVGKTFAHCKQQKSARFALSGYLSCDFCLYSDCGGVMDNICRIAAIFGLFVIAFYNAYRLFPKLKRSSVFFGGAILKQYLLNRRNSHSHAVVKHCFGGEYFLFTRHFKNVVGKALYLGVNNL